VAAAATQYRHEDAKVRNELDTKKKQALALTHQEIFAGGKGGKGGRGSATHADRAMERADPQVERRKFGAKMISDGNVAAASMAHSREAARMNPGISKSKNKHQEELFRALQKM
jgi:hypothetical protein